MVAIKNTMGRVLKKVSVKRACQLTPPYRLPPHHMTNKYGGGSPLLPSPNSKCFFPERQVVNGISCGFITTVNLFFAEHIFDATVASLLIT